jgi:hypothetical protein
MTGDRIRASKTTAVRYERERPGGQEGEADRRENLRFVRERSGNDSLERRFPNIDLQGQTLGPST